jgi:penicillin-binding protein 2
MFKSIVASCDTYYYMLAGETDIDDTYAFLSKFSFGRKTGIDIEGELIGTLPSRAWKRERFKDKWYLGDSISAGIGQGYNSFTPVQQAQAIAIIANDGVALAPHLVKSVENVKDGSVRQIALQPTQALNVRPEHLEVIKNALIGVPREGTSARAFVGTQYISAGKTGTAQVYSLKGEKYSARVDERLRDHAWYLAYAPADHPRIAIAVLVENGGFGAQAAAPIARAVFDYYLLGQKTRAPVAPGSGPREPDDESD